MTDAIVPAVAEDFRLPFIGYLPGYLAASEETAPGRPAQEVYDAAVMEQWRLLLDSPESQDERLVHAFLERHPSLLPGAYSVDGDSGHSAFPSAVITRPKLPDLSDREPDFMWIASDSGSLYPILIEIETPHKKWFHGDRAEIHSAFTHAQGQLAEWRHWFNTGHNRSAFLEYYEIPPDLARRRLEPRYVLIYGRRGNYVSSRRRQGKRAELARDGERLMSFDRLTPAKNSVLFSCVRKEQDGYRVAAVPPCLTIINNGERYQPVSGWDQALDDCHDMPPARRQYLKEQLHLLTTNPDAYVRIDRGMRVRRPQWL
ncbi:Shedu anti-phage system protein SduA domain-containing protein [Nonomuraea sp. NPDC026600]|uniref:Shedu anti-phage system protein SduA domain-containing protein n=1 Tax=Nonomuraea sp. NPDC026600 TaxID=3155363 RepID=UPI0033C7E154